MTQKVFIVTGASKGLGAAIANHLLRQSHKLVLAARSNHLLSAFKNTHSEQVEYLAADLTDAAVSEKLVNLAVKSFGRLDGLVLSHGVLISEKIEKTSIESFKHLYNVNVFSCLAIAQAAVPELRKHKGCIIWVSSGAARNPYVGWSAYGSSKAALNSLSTHLASEEKDMVSITVEPGRVDTDMQRQIRSAGEGSMDKTQYQSFVNDFEQGQLLKPERPGHVIARLVADPQMSLSGQSLKWNAPELASYQE